MVIIDWFKALPADAKAYVILFLICILYLVINTIDKIRYKRRQKEEEERKIKAANDQLYLRFLDSVEALEACQRMIFYAARSCNNDEDSSQERS